MADDPARKHIGQAKSMEEKGEKRSGDITAKLAGPSEMNKLRDQGLDLQRRRSLSEVLQQELSNFKTAESERTRKELEGVLLHTRRLTVCGECIDAPFRLGREGEKSGQDFVMRGDSVLQLHVVKWMSTDDETHLYLRDHVHILKDVISILAPLCLAVKHISFDFFMIHSHQLIHMQMRSVITVCFKSKHVNETFLEILLTLSNLFPNAESLDLQIDYLSSPSNQAYFPEVNSSSSVRELKLRYGYSYHITTDRLLIDIPMSCPNIVSLVLSGIGRWQVNKSGKDITSCKMPYLTNIQLESFETDDCYRFVTLLYVIHVFHVKSPCLRFVEAKKVQLGDAELTSVKWSRTSSGCELQLEGASAAVPMANLMHLVSNELKGITVLTFDRCKVEFPQSISHPPQSTGEESSLRELKFVNVEGPLSQTDIHKLSEMYPYVKVTVEHDSQASHEESKQGTRMPFKPERKTSPSSPPSSTSSKDELVEATARVQVHEEQTDSQNIEEERKDEKEEEEEEEEGEEEEEEEDYFAMEWLPQEIGEVSVNPIKMECCKRVGVEGGRLQLDSFGIELEIPPGAIDSEALQDISLRVLTDTPHLGNSKEEMSVCFGVQCLAPDDLVLKLPVTYTIPHCAVIRRYPSVKAVLYTGEGEYSPDAVVKERIVLTRFGTPSCIITKDVLKLKMNHFSWAKIKLWIKNFFFRGKKMCCRPFKEKNLALQKTPVILHAHLYDDIKGNSEMVESKEGKDNFIPALMEQEVLIHAAEGHLKMTCYVEETVIKEPVVSFDRLMGGARICEHFVLKFPNQPDSAVVSLKVGQNENLEVHFVFRLDFSTPHRIERASPQDQEESQSGSSSQTPQTSHQSPDETQENVSGRQEDFDDKLKTVARKVARRDEIDNLGKALGFEPEDIQRYFNTNMKNPDVSYMGTLSMLRDWRKKQTEATECEALKGVLEKADQNRLADELFGTS